jgi:hypothetical protein
LGTGSGSNLPWAISWNAFSVSLRSGGTTNVGVGTTNPDSPLTVVGTAASAAASSLTLAKEWKAQHVIYAQGAAYALKLGAHYTAGVSSYSSIQSTEFYSGTEHPGNLSLNPLGGNVGIGVTNPSQKLEVAGIVKATNGIISWSTTHTYYGGAGATWNPGDAGYWPVGGHTFLITMRGSPSYGGNAIRATFIVFHSRWVAGNNNFGSITPLSNSWVSAWSITDGGMTFTFNSPSAQDVNITFLNLN